LSSKIFNKFQSFINHTSVIRYYKNASWLILEKVFRMTFGLFISLWFARYLGPSDYGLFSYVVSFTGLFTVFATLGLDSIVVRELVNNQNREKDIIGTAFVLKLCGSLLSLLAIAIVLNLSNSDYNTNLLIFIVASSTLFQSFNVIDFYFQSKVMGKFVALANIISFFLGSLTRFVLIFFEAPLLAFAWAIFFDSFLLSIALFFFYFKHKRISFLTFFNFNIKDSIFLLKNSWPLILSGALISLYMKIDQVMLKKMLGNESVGQYSAAVRLSELWYFLPLIISTTFFPAIINAKKQNEKLYLSRIQSLNKFMFWTAFLIAVFMSFFSGWIVDILYGPSYSQSGPVLAIHIWAAIFVFIGVANNNYLIAENLQVYSILNTFIGAIVNIVLNFILIPRIGIEGAALATLIAYFISAYLSLLLWKKTRTNFKILSKIFY
jgi:O-antigen/teichoic acid export membrane protein